MNNNTMESSPLLIDVTLNQEGDGAILHINCQSDGKAERWLEDGEEGGIQAKNVWLGKLGCLLKLHGGIECQWPCWLMESDTNILSHPDKFNDPWAYRISTFPTNYKLFGVARPAKGENPPTKDHYLCGISFSSFLSIHDLTDSFH